MVLNPMKKIIVSTNDGKRISRTFKGCNILKEFLVEKGKIIKKIDRLNISTSWKKKKFRNLLNSFDYQQKESAAVKNIPEGLIDCEVIICRKMDRSTWGKLGPSGVEMIFTSLNDAENAVIRYLSGNLVDEYKKIMYE